MPTITLQDRSTPITASQSTQPSQDERRQAAIAKITGAPPEASITRQDAPGTIADQGGSLTPTPETKEPISDPSASGDDHIKQLAQREKAAWAHIKQLKAEKASLEASIAKDTESRMTKEEAIQLLRTDPSKLGLTYEDLGQLYLTGNTPVDPHVARLQAEIDTLKGLVQKTTSAAEEQAKSAYDQALKQIDSEANKVAGEVTKAQKAENAITKLIELTYQEDGILMDVEEAAATVEAHLEAEAIALFNKSSKLRSKLSPVATQDSLKNTNPPAQTRNNTLTPAMVQASAKPLSSRDRAIAAFKNNSR